MAEKKERKKVTTPVFRVSFPNVFAPSSFEGGDAKYGVSMLFTPAQFSESDKKAWAAMKALANEVSMEKFKKPLKDLPANFKQPFRKGEEKEGLDGYGAGVIFCNATSKMKPGLIDRDKTVITDQEAFYPGCYARATVTAFAYDNKGKGVAFGLNNIQKVKDGESFSGRVDAAEDFGDDLEEGASQAEDDPLA